DPRNLGVLDPERFEQRDRVRPLERGAHLSSIGEQIAVPLVGVVEEAAADGYAALLVDDEEIPTDALVDPVDAELELLATTRGDRSGISAGAARCRRGGGDAVLEPRAIVGERCEDLPVVDFDSIEI